MSTTTPETLLIPTSEARDAAIDIVLQSLGDCSQSVRYQVQMILVELINNGLEHGANARLSYAVADRDGVPTFTCTVSDEGDGFDTSSIRTMDQAVAETQEAVDNGGEKEGGLGLAIIGTMVDSMEFNEAGNGVTVTKSLVS